MSLSSSCFPSPLASTSLFSISVSLFLFYYMHSFILFFRFHTQVITYSTVFLWLISLSIIISRSIHTVANGRISFFLMANQHSIMCVYVWHFSLSFDGYLDYLHILAIVTSAVMSIWMHASFWNSIFIFFGYVPSSGNVRSCGRSPLIYLPVFHSGCSNL